MADVQEITEIPVDIDPAELGTVSNPFKRRVILGFNGKKYLFKASEERTFQLPIAIHFANHLAQMVIFDEHEKKIITMATKKAVALDGSNVEQIDEVLLMKLRKEPIPEFRRLVWEKMKTLVKTDSDFFKDKGAQKKATGIGEEVIEEDGELL